MRCAVNDVECVTGRLRVGLCEKHYRRWLKHGTTDNARIDNFQRYAPAPNGCWLWAGSLWPNGYAMTSVKVHGTTLAHRAFYIEHVGPIPEGMDIDHECHNSDATCVRGPSCKHRACVNPDHLAPVSRRTNVLRAIEAQAVCEAGLHDLTVTGGVKHGTRQCVECWRARYRKAGAKYRAKRNA